MIDPLDLPSAAGIEFGDGDARHFSEDDAMDVPSLQNPTRHLAERDNRLAKKLNEVVSEVNNKEQFVPLPVLNTVIPPLTEEIINNFRIPPGFEARVLNATVASTPASSDVTLSVRYAPGFGNSTGAEVVSTSNEFTSGIQFYSNGEFIVVLKNTGSLDLTCMASITLTIRPIGSTASLLVGNIIQGQEGKPGRKGELGLKGDPGVGAPGTPGLVWRNEGWVVGLTYAAPTDVVAHVDVNGVISSYVAAQTHVAALVNAPPNPAFWHVVAEGSVGVPGVAGGTVQTANVSATLLTGSDWTGQAVDGYDASAYAASNSYTKSVVEMVVKSGSGKLAFLHAAWRFTFRGSGTIQLPKIAGGGAFVDYANSSIFVAISANGTQAVEVTADGNQARGFTCVPSSTDKWTVKSLSGHTQQCAVIIYGAQYVA